MDSANRNEVNFTLSGSIPGNSYIAVGFSNDAIMGNDGVIVCSTWEGDNSPGVELFKGYNDQSAPEAFVTEEDLSDYVHGVEVVYENGRVTCNFELNEWNVTKPNGEMALFSTDYSYHIMLAHGNMESRYKLRAHIAKMATGNEMSFDVYDREPKEPSSTLVKAHASLMVIAWFLAGSLGTFIAMYCKEQFSNYSVFGIQPWFALHRCLMIITWLCGVSGLICIVARYDFRPLNNTSLVRNNHALVGIISTMFMFVQPFLAVLRCAPDHRLRPVFTALHFSLGCAASILSWAAVFMTTEDSFKRVTMKDGTEYIVIAYIAFSLVMHLGMMIYTAVRWKNRKPMDIVVTGALALFFIGILSMTITLLVYVLGSTYN